jgi:inosine/xanthosine triphosphate pyrophosphatase family protein
VAPVKNKININYVTSSPSKIQENDIFREKGQLPDGTPVKELFDFKIRSLPIKETLEIDIQVMVKEEVSKAYAQLKVPCIVEHAGLIFMDRLEKGYPGGLTKPMWDALRDQFIFETRSANREAIARAVVAYCDGMNILTFVGEREGRIAANPRGSREFYWDTIFIPKDSTRTVADKTYAEIADDPDLGLEFKVLRLSQSTIAMINFLEHLRSASRPKLWP